MSGFNASDFIKSVLSNDDPIREFTLKMEKMNVVDLKLVLNTTIRQILKHKEIIETKRLNYDELEESNNHSQKLSKKLKKATDKIDELKKQIVSKDNELKIVNGEIEELTNGYQSIESLNDSLKQEVILLQEGISNQKEDIAYYKERYGLATRNEMMDMKIKDKAIIHVICDEIEEEKNILKRIKLYANRLTDKYNNYEEERFKLIFRIKQLELENNFINEVLAKQKCYYKNVLGLGDINHNNSHKNINTKGLETKLEIMKWLVESNDYTLKKEEDYKGRLDELLNYLLDDIIYK